MALTQDRPSANAARHKPCLSRQRARSSPSRPRKSSCTTSAPPKWPRSTLATTRKDSLGSVSFSLDGRTVLLFRDSGVEVRDAETEKFIVSWKRDSSGFFGGRLA